MRENKSTSDATAIWNLLLLIMLLFSSSIRAQKAEEWVSFRDHKTELIGYKDLSGKVKVKAQFGGFTKADVFRNIIAVTDARYRSYYLLKNGREIGRDSTYVFDFSFDCEQEGMIRFRDDKTDKVGFFNGEGEISVPAQYNDARPFHNGVAVALYNGKRICYDGNAYDPKNPCEHWIWDGVTALVNPTGDIIVDSLDINALQDLNWYSLQLSVKPAAETIRDSFKAKRGGYYTFINYKKEFEKWFFNAFLKANESSSVGTVFEMVALEGLSQKAVRTMYTRKAFLDRYQKVLAAKLKGISANIANLQVVPEELNNMVFTKSQFRPFYTDCGEPNTARYPLFDVIINRGKGMATYQERYSFLRSKSGYQLIEVTWRDLRH